VAILIKFSDITLLYNDVSESFQAFQSCEIMLRPNFAIASQLENLGSRLRELVPNSGSSIPDGAESSHSLLSVSRWVVVSSVAVEVVDGSHFIICQLEVEDREVFAKALNLL